jgi:ABC-type molybdate transport system substrate-binding protein
MKMRHALLAGIAFALFAHRASAAEIKVLTPRAGSTLLAEIGPQFERATGNKISVSVDLAAALTRRVKAGEDFDLLLAAPGQIEGLAKDGKVMGDSITNVLRSGLGVELAGPLPQELQNYITFAGAVGTQSMAPDAARELIKFLKGPAALPVMKAQGMEPG